MRRIQLYLDDQLCGALHVRARSEKTTISKLIQQAVRERYLTSDEQRMAAMQRFVGNEKSHPAKIDSTEHVRALRRGSRLDDLGEL